MSKSVFGFEMPEDSPGFLLWQTTIIWQRLIKKALDPYNVSHSQFVILAITLWFETQNHEASQTHIIQQSKLDKMTVSKALKTLATENYIKRQEHTDDPRAKAVMLTKKGRELITSLIPVIEAIDAEFFDGIKKTDLRLFNAVLEQLSNHRLD